MLYKDKWYSINNGINLDIPIGKRDNVYSELSGVIEKLNLIEGLKYFFSCGTALGLVRDGHLLPWDNDVDIDVICPTHDQIAELESIMFASGYVMKRDLSNHLGKVQLVFVKDPYHCIDFCFWHEENESYINDVPESLFSIRRHSKSLYRAFYYLEVNNCNFKIPDSPDEYFAYLYGKDWKTPKVYRNWLRNAHDLRIDLKLLRVLSKLWWRIDYSLKRRFRPSKG